MNEPTPRGGIGLRAALAMIVLAAGLASGCSNPYADICERGALCRGSNDLDIDACVIEQEAREEVASIWGCDDQWNAYIDCMVVSGNCNGGNSLTGCDAFKDAWERCVPR